MTRKNTEADFWKRVDKHSNPRGCWEWLGSKGKQGYGMMAYHGKNILTHRLSMIFDGHIVEGWDVLHGCDNPSCVNPAHLSLGTHTDNMRDMIAKGRYVHPPTAGRKKKLTDDQVREIRAAADSRPDLARKYNVTPYTIDDVRSGRCYKEVI